MIKLKLLLEVNLSNVDRYYATVIYNFDKSLSTTLMPDDAKIRKHLFMVEVIYLFLDMLDQKS